MKFVVKEFLSARFAGLPRGRWPGLTASCWTASHWSFPGNGLERIAGGPGYRKLRPNARSGSTPRYFWRFIASNDGVRRFEAGGEIQGDPRTTGREPHHLVRRTMTAARCRSVS